MKSIKLIFATLFLGITLTVSAQTFFDAGPDQTIYCNGSVQLNATPVKGWGLLPNTPASSSYMSVYFTSELNGYVVGATGAISHTTDGGTTWTKITLDPSQIYYCVYFTSATTGYIGGSSGVMLKTIDGGTSWNPLTIGSTITIRSICFTSPTVGYAAGTAGTILKTTDGGTSWTKLSTGVSATLYSICFPTQSTGFATGLAGTILKTTDAGATWTQQTYGTGVLYATNFVNANTGFSVGSLGTIMKTTDGGGIWSKYTADSIFIKYESGVVNRTNAKLMKSCIFLGSSFINDSTGFAVGSYGAAGIFLKTTDAGNTWYETPSLNSGKMQGAYMVNDKVGYAAGTGGKIMKFDMNQTLNIVMYKWYPADGLNDSHIANPVASPQTNTTYYLSVSDGMNVYSDSVNVRHASITTTNAPYAYIGCEGSVKLDSVKPIYSGTERLSYKWTPSTGLSSDTVPNPIATVTSETTYFLTVSTSNCSGYGGVTVVVQPLIATASVDKTIIGNGSAQLNVKTNYSGTSPLHYKWTPSTGLSNDTIPNPIVSVTSQTVYSVSVTSRTGCSASGMITVKVTPLTVNAGVDKTIQCGGSTQLSVTSNYTGTGTLRYKWTPSTGLNNDTIATPTATLNSTTTYSLLLTNPTGNTATDQVIVNVTPVTVNAGRDTTVICGGKVPLVGVTTTYTGTGLRYRWTPATGLSNDTILSPYASPVSNTTYTLTVTTPAGCTATDNVLVKVSNLTVNAGVDKTGVCGAQVQLGAITTNYTGASADLHYKWTPSTGLNYDTIANPLATVGATKTYTLTISTKGGCTASDAVVVSSLQFSKPTISYVGINSNNKNQLIWTNPTPTKDVLFNIYKETNITNSYLKIGSLQSGIISTSLVFVDTASMPDVQSNKYKLTMIDECGNESAVSDYHKTMHLSINKGINTIWNLIWEAYEGYAVSTYNIYRGTTPANIQIIGSLSGSNTQFSDYTAPAGYVYYQVEAVSSTAAGARQLAKSSSEVAYYSSRSNIATNKSGIDGLYNVKDISDRLNVSPNPASCFVRLTVDDQGTADMQLYIYNAVGQVVKTQDNVYNGQLINVSTLNNGLYMLVVKSNGFTGMHKLLIQK